MACCPPDDSGRCRGCCRNLEPMPIARWSSWTAVGGLAALTLAAAGWSISHSPQQPLRRAVAVSRTTTMTPTTSTSTMPVTTTVPPSPLPLVNSTSIWQVSVAYPAVMGVADISCPWVTTCFAAGLSSSQGGEVLKTVNTGATWQPEILPSGVTPISNISCPSVSVCFATESQSVLMTHDAGTTWTLLNDPQGSTTADVACPSITICYAVGEINQGNPFILATTDSGTTWAPLNLAANESALRALPGLTGISCPSETVCYAMGGGDYLVTEDSGATWTVGTGLVDGTRVKSGSGPGPYGGTITCPSTTMCLTNGIINVRSGGIPSGILVTTDSGRTWVSEKLPLRIGVFGFSCPSTRVCFAIGAGGYGYGSRQFAAILSSTDGGGSWRTSFHIQAAPGINEIACSTTTTCVAGEEDGDTVNVTTDSGSTWTTHAFPPGLEVGEVTCPSTAVCYVTSSDGVLTTADSGSTWAVRALPSNNSPIAISCPSPRACFVVVQTNNRHREQFLSTTNSGHTWSVIHSWTIVPGLSPSELNCPATTTCYAASNANVEVTTDSGRTWRIGFGANAGYRGLDSISCPSITTCYVTDSFGIVATKDSGVTWRAQRVPDGTKPEVTGVACTSLATCVAVGQDSNCENEGDDPCAAGTLAVLATKNAGDGWSGYTIPDDINLNAVACPRDGHCYAVAFVGIADGYNGGGDGAIIASSNSGATWISQAVPAATGGLTSISCPSASTCYAVGEGTGDVGGLILKANDL